MAEETLMSDQNLKKSTYFRVRLSQVPAEAEDILTTYCFEHGANGVSEALNYSQPDLTYDPKILSSRNHELDVFFESNPHAEFFQGLLPISSRIQSMVYEEEQKDWLAEWKKGFKPFQLVGGYWIIPSWEPTPPECQFPIFIDPGMAFGTGTHATTKMMAFFIHKLAEQNKSIAPNWSLLDVGTGTAILAILAKMGGFGKVIGIEIDPEARRVAKENVEKNNFKNEIAVPDSLLEEIHESYDVVVANIIDGVLIQLKDQLMNKTKSGGHLLLTGILQERDDEFFESFIENSGLKVIRRLEKDEWVGYWTQKP